MCYGDKNLGVVSVASCSSRRTTYTTITVFLAMRVDQMEQTIGSPYILIATISFTNDMATRCSRLEPCALKGARTVLRGRGGSNVPLLPDSIVCCLVPHSSRRQLRRAHQ